MLLVLSFLAFFLNPCQVICFFYVCFFLSNPNSTLLKDMILQCHACFCWIQAWKMIGINRSLIFCFLKYIFVSCPASGSLLWRKSFWASWRSSVRRSRTPAWSRAPSVSSWVWSSSGWRCIPWRTLRRLFNSCRYSREYVMNDARFPGCYTTRSHSNGSTAPILFNYSCVICIRLFIAH